MIIRQEQDRMNLITQADKIEKVNTKAKVDEQGNEQTDTETASIDKKESSSRQEELKKKKNRKKCGPYKKRDKKDSPTKKIKKEKKKKNK